MKILLKGVSTDSHGKSSDVLNYVSLQGFYQLLEPKVTVRCRKQDVQLVQVSVAEFRNYSFSFFSFLKIYMSLSGFHPEEHSHIQSRREEQPGGPHRPEQFPLPRHVSSILVEPRLQRCLVQVLICVGVVLPALEVWRSTTAMARSKCPTPWRAGWS